MRALHLNARAQTVALIGEEVRNVVDLGDRVKRVAKPPKAWVDPCVYELALVHVEGEPRPRWVAVERLGVAEVDGAGGVGVTWLCLLLGAALVAAPAAIVVWGSLKIERGE